MNMETKLKNEKGYLMDKMVNYKMDKDHLWIRWETIKWLMWCSQKWNIHRTNGYHLYIIIFWWLVWSRICAGVVVCRGAYNRNITGSSPAVMRGKDRWSPHICPILSSLWKTAWEPVTWAWEGACRRVLAGF